MARAWIDLTVPRNRNRAHARLVKVYSTSLALPREDITRIDLIPVTRPARTLLDLAALEPDRIADRLDDALRRGLVSLRFLDTWLADGRRNRHRGRQILRALVETRQANGITGSPLETRFLKLLAWKGLPLPWLQYVLEDGGRRVAQLDFAYPEHRVGIETDGFAFHDTRRSFDRERARGNDVTVLGWRVLRITDEHLEHEPERAAAWIVRALGGAPQP